MMKVQFMMMALLLMALASCGPTPKEAGAYNDKLMAQQKAVVLKYDKMLETFDTYVPAKMDAALLSLMEQLDVSKNIVRDIEPVAGGEALKEEVLRYISVFEDAASDDFDYLIRLYKVPENEFTAEVRIQWDSRYKEVDTKLKDAAAHLKAVQQAFAENFNLTIIK